MKPRIIDDLIRRLLSWKVDKQPQLMETSITHLLEAAYVVLKNEPMLLELDAPINILGDLHGQFGDLLRYFDNNGYPPHKNYLFLGDYVDRGKNSVETLSLLLAFKVKFPLSIYLLRGNHESAIINHSYGFYDECKRRFTIRLFKRFVDTYSYMPVAAIIRNRIFCCHGGLSPVLYELNNIRNIKRPCEIKNSGLLCDLLWSDPDPEVTGWAKNTRGCSFVFGTDVVDLFLKRFDFDLICRAHQVVEDGFEFFAKKQLVTIFSAVNYCGEYDNAGAMMCVDAGLTITMVLQKPTKTYIDTKQPATPEP